MLAGGAEANLLAMPSKHHRVPQVRVWTSCCSAAQHIERGDADLMLAGGAEAAIIPSGIGGFIACKALSKRNGDPEAASRPWDKGRDGFVMGEGAGEDFATLVTSSKLWSGRSARRPRRRSAAMGQRKGGHTLWCPMSKRACSTATLKPCRCAGAVFA